LGLSDYRDDWSALLLEDGEAAYLALWRRGGESQKTISLPQWAGKQLTCAYPSGECDFLWEPAAGELTVKFPEPVMARIFELN
jgi:hypothetical protein